MSIGARVMNEKEFERFKKQDESKQQLTLLELEAAKTIKCEKCNSVVWDTGFIMKKTSPLSRVGEHTIQLPVIYCKSCGFPFPESCPVAI